ncbi:unnamed protein product [Spirodela intermedia]|uniref:Uncharacterized protein n=1 Tax=Spirodela intermedia TaxID=51605 RepID=A0A7I8KHJ4_SPIIN|nr:unnamed protein product [Spirodela intermedia]
MSNGRELGDIYGEVINLAHPGVPLFGGVHGPEGPPDGAVALEAGAEGDLPGSVPLLDPPFALGVGQLVPEGAARGVPEAVERHARRLQVPVRQVQVLLDLVQHGTPSGVDAEVLEGQLEVRDVGLDLHLEELLPHQGREEEQLLGHGEDEGAQRGDIGLQGVPRDGHQVLGQGDPDLALSVLLLGDAAEALVVPSLVGPNGVNQLVLGSAPVRPPVGQHDRRPAHAEQAGDVLHADDQGVGVGMHLEKVLGEVDGDEAGAAPHSPEVVAQYVPPELVVVDDHGGEGRGRVEQAAIHDQDADVLGLRVGLRKELVERPEHHRLGFLPGLGHAGIRRNVQNRLGEVSGLAEAGSLQDLPLEIQVLLRECPRQPGPLHEDLAGALARVLGLIAGEIDEVDGAGPGEEVEGAEEHEEGGAEEHGDEVEAKVVPEVVEIIRGEGGELRDDDADQGDQHEVHPVGDKVVVPQLHILQFDGLLEVGEATRRSLRRRGLRSRLGHPFLQRERRTASGEFRRTGPRETPGSWGRRGDPRICLRSRRDAISCDWGRKE